MDTPDTTRLTLAFEQFAAAMEPLRDAIHALPGCVYPPVEETLLGGPTPRTHRDDPRARARRGWEDIGYTHMVQPDGQVIRADNINTGTISAERINVTRLGSAGQVLASGGWVAPSRTLYEAMAPVEEDDIPAGYLDEDGERARDVLMVNPDTGVGLSWADPDDPDAQRIRNYWSSGPGSATITWTADPCPGQAIRLMYGQPPYEVETLL